MATPIVEHHRALSLRFLADGGYLRPGCTTTGRISWKYSGRPDGTANLEVVSHEDGTAEVYITHSLSGEQTTQRVSIITNPSNLGRGVVRYFRCPQTARKCRKLFYMGVFCSRHGFGGKAIYHSQAEAKTYRNAVPEPEHLDSRYPTHYAGKPTRRYLRYLKQREKHHRGVVELYGKIAART